MQDVSTDLLCPFCQLVDECYSCLHEGDPVTAWLAKAWWEEGAMYPHIPMITQVVSQPNPISSKPPADLGSPLLTVSLRQPKSMWFWGSRKGAPFFSSAGCRDNRWVTRDSPMPFSVLSLPVCTVFIKPMPGTSSTALLLNMQQGHYCHLWHHGDYMGGFKAWPNDDPRPTQTLLTLNQNKSLKCQKDSFKIWYYLLTLCNK